MLYALLELSRQNFNDQKWGWEFYMIELKLGICKMKIVPWNRLINPVCPMTNRHHPQGWFLLFEKNITKCIFMYFTKPFIQIGALAPGLDRTRTRAMHWFQRNCENSLTKIFYRTTGPISTRLGTKHFWVKWIQLKIIIWTI